MSPKLFDGWMPIRIYWRGNAPCVDWCYVGECRFTDPFWIQTIEHCLSHPFNQAFRRQTPVEVLEALKDVSPGLPPSGFIFHMSRCGSTLITRMLSTLPRSLVLSEPVPIDMLLYPNYREAGIGDEKRIGWLQAMVSALGRSADPRHRHFFIKLEACSVLHLSLIRQAFPDVPWIFVYRDGVEVMAAQLQWRGPYMIPGQIAPELLGMEIDEIFSMNPDEYCLKVLASMCRSALDHQGNGRSALVSYRELPDAVWSLLPECFSFGLTEDDRELMRPMAALNAKDPARPFTDDSLEKRRSVPESLRCMAEEWLGPLHERLEAVRRAQREAV